MGDGVSQGAEFGPVRATTCAVVVTYNPEPGLAGRLAPVLGQVGHVVVVDNASQNSPAADVAALGQAATLVQNPTNVGLAIALNQGVQMAIARGAAWVLLLDDDSHVHDVMLATYAAAIARRPDSAKVAMIGCNFWDVNRGRVGVHPYYRRFGDWVTCNLMTSGTLLRASAYAEVGPFRDDLFIDWIDFEYNLRARRAGFEVLMVSDVLMDHSLGKPVLHRWPVRKLCNHHSPFRVYFWIRNRAVVLKEYRGHVPADLQAIAVGPLKTLQHILLHEDRKVKRTQAVLLGLWHARRRRMGAPPPGLTGARHG